jgi:ATP-dependent RNA helicase DBP3
MAQKRSYEDLVDRDRKHKKAKKEKSRKEDKVNTIPSEEQLQRDIAVPEPSTTELSKDERKAIKRAKKEQAKLKPLHERTAEAFKDSGYSSPATKEERKALKRALKVARKAERPAHTSEAATNGQAAVEDGTAGSTSSATGLSPAAAGYREHNALTALPQVDIDKYVSEQVLTIEDPLKQTHRPIISFDYLPVKDDAERAPFADFSSPTPVQAACWPYLLSGRDVVGVAETGSGKTLAFGLPCIRHIQALSAKQRRAINACMVSPTRELAMQIYEQLAKLAEPAQLKVTCVYGGVSKDVQRDALPGTNILVATPGRLNDFMQEGVIDISKATYLVLDEADRMLDKGFEDDVRKIISRTSPTGRQTLMFTATWPPSVRDLASTFMETPVRVTIGDNPGGELRANARISQEVEVIDEWEKQARLIELLKQYQSGINKKDRILVFCLYKKEATRIEEFIRRKGFSVAGIHGDLNQQKRTESLDAFKRGVVPLLVATDVAARGLDIPAVKVVINVTFPLTVEDYVHRIGR